MFFTRPISFSRVIAPLLVAALAMFSSIASATDLRPFDQAAFEQAQAQNQPIVVFVHAPWCPVCKSQMKTIDQVTADPAFKDLVIFRIDFDTQPTLWKPFGATMQSTLIGFHGKKETGRIAHVTDEALVTDVLRKTLG